MGSFYVKKTKEGISSCEKKELMIKIWKGKAYNEVIGYGWKRNTIYSN